MVVGTRLCCLAFEVERNGRLGVKRLAIFVHA